MTSIKILDLPQMITDRLGVVLYDNIVELLHPDPNKVNIVFGTVLKKSLMEMARTYPVQLKRYTQLGRSYKFVDNFQEYLEGKFTDENEIILKPVCIYFVKSGSMALNSQWWDYIPSQGLLKLKFGGGNAQIEYAANYPIVMKYSPDNNFTEDSKVYYIGEHNQEVFLDFLSYYIVRQIKLTMSSIQLGGSIQFLQGFESLSSELEQLVNTHKEHRSDILRMWRK